jgi:4-hydroxy-tetrahydrodipicolinate synthase
LPRDGVPHRGPDGSAAADGSSERRGTEMRMKGVFTALLTPFAADGSVDIPALQTLVRHVVGAGGEGLVPLGTTGEGYAVTAAERAEILRAVQEAADPSTILIAGATEITTRDAIADASLAAELGYHAVMIAAPPYVLPDPIELAEHFRAVARASALPVILYDYPARTGVSIGSDCLDALVDEPLVIAIKEASGDLGRMIRLRQRYGGRYQFICGTDSLILDFVLWGADAWIAGTANVLPREHSELLALARAGRTVDARKALENLLPMLLSTEEGGYTHKIRAALQQIGLPAGHARGPLRDDAHPLPADVVQLLAQHQRFALPTAAPIA